MGENVGVILAGGRSSRMGENKAAMLFAGKPLLGRVLARVSVAVDETMVIGPESLHSLVPSVRVVGDLTPGIGPLGGLYAALTSTLAPRIFLVACDMPFVQPSLVRAMLAASVANQNAEVITLGARQRLQPLHAVYTQGCLPAVERALASEDHSLRTLLAHLNVLTLDAETVRREDPQGLSTFNINTPEDWQEALRLAAPQDAPHEG